MRPPLIRYTYAFVVLLLTAYAFFTLRGPHGIPALLSKQKDIREMEERNARLARQVELKRDRIHRLRESQSAQELEIRQRLKLVRPKEKVFILQEHD